MLITNSSVLNAPSNAPILVFIAYDLVLQNDTVKIGRGHVFPYEGGQSDA